MIKQLDLTQFRNISLLSLQPAAQFTVLWGLNGSGKTSILEAVYYLVHGRSFRRAHYRALVQYNADYFRVCCQFVHEVTTHLVGIERSLSGNRSIRYDGKTIRSLVPIAQKVPIQLITANSHLFFAQGSKTRRRFLNWGLFHMEPRFLPSWSRLQHVLQQRNAALKRAVSRRELTSWDKQLIELAYDMNTWYRDYVTALQPLVCQLLAHFVRLTVPFAKGRIQVAQYIKIDFPSSCLSISVINHQ